MSKSAIFVAAAIAVTAICVAVIASFGFSLSFGESTLAGFAALAGLTVIHLAFVKAAPADDGRLDGRIEGLDGLVQSLQQRLETVEARLTALDGAATARARAAAKPLVEEIAALGGLVTAIAKEVAVHDVEIDKLKAANEAALEAARNEPPGPPPARVATAPTVEAPAPVQPLSPVEAAPPAAAAAPAPPMAAGAAAPAAPAPEPEPLPEPLAAAPVSAPVDAAPVEAAPAQPASAPRADLAARVARALEDGRIEPYLQPIVTLPSRRVAHYEALARMGEGDATLAAADFLPGAFASGRIGEIDRVILEGAAAIAGRLATRGVGAVFVNVAFGTLADAASRDALVELFRTRRELAPLIALELAQRDFTLLAGEARMTLERLVLLGVRLSIDGVNNLRFDARELARRGVRFVKTPAARLIDPDAAKSFAVHPADLAGLLARHGVDLIATHVEEDRVVPELIELDVRFAQGRLFGAPRPIRSPAPSAPAAGPAPRPVTVTAPTRLVPRAVAAR